MPTKAMRQERQQSPQISRHEISESYTPKLIQQVKYLNQRTLFIWICGVLFTRLAAGVWFGDRPLFVLMIILALVYVYMHLGYYATMLIRFPFVLSLLYVCHAQLVQPGDLLLLRIEPISWAHVAIIWLTMNFSFVLRAERFPFHEKTLHWMPETKSASPKWTLLALGKAKVIPLFGQRNR